ncbi:hypothetical protein Pla108_25970 [Botrimarina colliarenosi]|uniref:PEP-CTERM protein-sorting domain-containing protein n=1 Tax=Botrimarina colliarenosi TaxID=2528001 RepID=A0A5C6AF21_9BACT|nr:hypothetical protein [Botrimarina colliarenosi]TWT96823.1 hypothetical protein Pla108_25970 [Botrimarina colliarenosi]
MKTPLCFRLIVPLIALPVGGMTALAADPWADRVVSYDPGTGVPAVFGSNPPVLFDVADAALGMPTRQSVAFGGYVVSPFSAPTDPTEVVALGDGGTLVVAFDEPVTDDPLNPFGIDLLVFGNAFFLTSDYNFDAATTVTGVDTEGGILAISADGVNWDTVTNLDADGLYPTNGYADTTDFFPASPGGVLADFTLPVDPAFNPNGLGAEALVAGYGGSGGGAGIDIGAYGLSSVSYVRVTNASGSGFTPEIDGFADVSATPEPTSLLLVALATLPVFRRGR